MLDSLQDLFLRGGVDAQSYDHSRPSIENSNRSSLIVYSAAGVLFLAVMFIASFVVDSVAVYRPLYLLSTLFAVLILLYATLWFKHWPKLLLPCVYTFTGILYAFGIVLGTASSPDSLCVTFMVLLVMIPLLFTDRPIRVSIMTLAAMLCFDITVLLLKTGDTRAVDVLDGTVFGLLSCVVSTHMMTVKIGKIVYADRADMLSHTDLLTGCRNRNCYEQQFGDYAKSCRKSLACVYVDVNGLHEMNNAHGHTAGDTMLRFVADQLKANFPADAVYRIGGDEFVVLVRDMERAELERRLNSMLAALDEHTYHAAIGFEQQKTNELDLLKLVRIAEERMYSAKADYYRAIGQPERIRR